MADRQLDILELMLNTPKARDEYVTALDYQDDEGNVDLSAIINDNLASKQESAARVAETGLELSSVIQQTIDSGSAVKTAQATAATARGNIFNAATTDEALKADIGKAEFDELVGAQGNIRIATEELIADTNQLQQRARSTTSELFADIEIVDAGKDLNLVDFLVDPVNSIKKNIAAGKAEVRIVDNKAELDIIAKQQQFVASSTQIETSALTQQAELMATASIRTRYEQLDSAQALATAQRVGVYTESQLEDTKAIYDLDNKHAAMLSTKLNGIIAAGNANVSTVNAATQAIRTNQTGEQYAQIKKLAEREETARAGLESKFLSVSKMLELPYESFAEYEVARGNGLVSLQAQDQIAQTMYTGLVGTAAVSASVDPLTRYEVLSTLVGDTAFTPAYDIMMTRVDAIAAKAVDQANIVQANDTAAEALKKRNNTMTNLFQAIPDDFNELYRNDIVQLFSPDAMDLSPAGGITNMPAGALAEVAKWSLPTGNLDSWVNGAIDYAANSEMPTSILAQAMAAIAANQFNGVKQLLGMSIDRMSTRALGNNSKSIGDATNAGDWSVAMELARVGRLTRAESAAVSALIANPPVSILQ